MRDALESRGFLALFPQASGSWWEKASTSAVSALLDEILQVLNVDPNRVYLTGFSNGGTGTFLYATLWPHRLAAAASLMGGGLPFFGPEPPAVDNIRALPVLFVHGDKDEVIPTRATVATVKEIQRRDATAPVESHILAGRGHDIVVGADDGLTLPFLEARKRDPFPRRLRFATRSLEFARAFWIEIKAKDGGLADAQAEIGPENTIDVTTHRISHLRLLLRRELISGEGPVLVRWNGREAFRDPFQEDCALLASTWQKTHDPFLAHSFEVDLDATLAQRALALPHR
jgi:dienelactone hydrolase